MALRALQLKVEQILKSSAFHIGTSEPTLKHPCCFALMSAAGWYGTGLPSRAKLVQMMFALKEIVIEPIEREPALPKGGLELEEDSSTHSLENQSSGASSSTRTSDETEMSAETTETDMRVSQAARPSGSSATSHESSSDQQSDGVSTFSRSTRMTRRTPFWVAGAADMRQDESQSHSLGLSVANHDPIPDLHCPEHPD